MKTINVSAVIEAHARKTKRMKVLEHMPSILQLVDARVPYNEITTVVSEAIGEEISQNYVYMLVREVREQKTGSDQAISADA